MFMECILILIMWFIVLINIFRNINKNISTGKVERFWNVDAVINNSWQHCRCGDILKKVFSVYFY